MSPIAAAPLRALSLSEVRVLEGAGIVHSVRLGRESLYKFDPQPVREMQEYLGRVSAHWDEVLQRLKALVEG